MDWPKFCNRYFWVLLCVVVGVAFVLRVWRLHLPESYVFDEVYHAVTAREIAAGTGRALEWWHEPPEPGTALDWLHPPLAKFFQAGAVQLFGYSSFSWRVFSALFGTGVVGLVGVFGRKLFDARAGLFAASLAAVEGLLLVQSRIAMNDIFLTAWVLAAAAAFWPAWQRGHLDRRTLVWTGVLVGLSWATKWSGVFASGAVLVLGLTLALKNHTGAARMRQLARTICCAFGIPVLVYLASYTPTVLQHHSWSHIWELHQQIWWYQTHLDATHPYQSSAASWPLGLRPVWYAVEYGTTTRADIYAGLNLGIAGAGLGALGVAIWQLYHRAGAVQSLTERQSRLRSRYLLIWYVLLWAPWALSPRILFLYHYTPSLPFLLLLLAGVIAPQKKYRAQLEGAILLASIGFAALWYPHWTALPVSNEFANAVYFMLPSWK